MRGLDGASLAVLLLGVAAGVLLIVGEFLPVATIDISGLSESCESYLANQGNADRCSLSGFERHGSALGLLGLLALVMAWGAGLGRSRPAAVALIVVGALSLGVSLLSDLPETNETGAIGRSFEGATAQKGPGLYVDWLGAALALGAGALRLSRPGDPPE